MQVIPISRLIILPVLIRLITDKSIIVHFRVLTLSRLSDGDRVNCSIILIIPDRRVLGQEIVILMCNQMIDISRPLGKQTVTNTFKESQVFLFLLQTRCFTGQSYLISLKEINCDRLLEFFRSNLITLIETNMPEICLWVMVRLTVPDRGNLWGEAQTVDFLTIKRSQQYAIDGANYLAEKIQTPLIILSQRYNIFSSTLQWLFSVHLYSW